MDHLRFRGEGRQLSGNAIIEPRPDSDQQVALLHGEIGIRGAVHAEHVQGLRLTLIEAAQAHQCHRDRQIRLAGELAQLLARHWR